MVEPTWSTACLDWKRRICDRRSLIPFKPLFPASAEQKMAVFTSLRIVDLPGKPTFGEASDEWLLDFAAAVFGAFDPATNRQLITEYMLLISKKNTKSTLAAGIMLTELACGFREYDENLIIAPTKEVAANSFIPALGMIEADDELNGLLHTNENLKLIKHRDSKSILKIVAADSKTVAGKKASRVLIDELWLFGEMANADAMLKEATGGQVSRPEGYTVYLTTQSDKPPTGVFKQKLALFRDIRDGKVQDRRKLPVLYEFPEEMVFSGDHMKPENFYVTNPNIGRSVTQEWLEEKAAEADHGEPGPRAVFYAKHLNAEIGMRLRADRWAGADFWQRSSTTLTLADLIARCEVIIVGLDGGGMDDLYGMTVLGRENAEIEVKEEPDPDLPEGLGGGTRRIKRWLSWSHAWAHEIVLDRRKTIAPKLLELKKAGEVSILADGAMAANGLPADIAAIVKIIVMIRDAGLLHCVAVDPAGLGELVDALAEAGITVENRENGREYLVGAAQGFAMMNALKTAERKLANGTLQHAAQALMDWCVGNLKIEATATAIRATKQTAGDAKIDPAMALFNAVTFMATNPDACRSAYETRGLLVL